MSEPAQTVSQSAKTANAQVMNACLVALDLANAHYLEPSTFVPLYDDADAGQGHLHVTVPFDLPFAQTAIRHVRYCKHSGDFDGTRVSDFDHLVTEADLGDHQLNAFGHQVLEWLRHMRPSHAPATKLSLQNHKRPKVYVLIIDQPADDIRTKKTDQSVFDAMIDAAESEFPSAQIVVLRPFIGDGHIREKLYAGRAQFAKADDDPWEWLDYALGVFTHSSDWGYLAMVAGHRPFVFGTPFYSGRGLSTDQERLSFRSQTLTLAQLTALYVGKYCQWVDLDVGACVDFSEAMVQFEAELRAWREDCQGWNGRQIALWKRPHFQKMLGRYKPMSFKGGRETTEAMSGDQSKNLGWGWQEEEQVASVEDGFLRSRGLGAALVPPLSMVLDQRGLYYNPNEPSDLEIWIERSLNLPSVARERAEALIHAITDEGISKYNLESRSNTPLPFEHGYHLVLGQVEDDASMRFGGQKIATNDALLLRVHQDFSNDTIVFKPHPDVEAGLRRGRLRDNSHAHHIAHNASIDALIEGAAAVHTMTSLGGFEALLRGKKVHTYGVPFYAGWGLTLDHGKIPERRKARPELWQLVHATLIDYPRYFDPVRMRPASVERVIELLGDTSWQERPRYLHWAALAQRLLRRVPYGTRLWRWRRQ